MTIRDRLIRDRDVTVTVTIRDHRIMEFKPDHSFDKHKSFKGIGVKNRRNILDWTTRVLPELIAPYGVDELHTAWFFPKGWPGKGLAVTLLIPECEMQFIIPTANGEPTAIINRPKTDKNIKGWIRSACEIARDSRAAIAFACDTHEQVERAVKLASKLLPGYERTALERMYRADTRARGKLN